MMMIGRFRFSFLVLAAVVASMTMAVPVCADDAAAKLDEAKFDEKIWDPKVYEILEDPANLIDPETEFTLVPPPANSSDETKKEIEFMLWLAQNKRSKIVTDKIVEENTGLISDVFAKGGYLVLEGNQRLVDLLMMADHEMRYFTIKYKKQFMRIRPSVQASLLGLNLERVIDNPGHPAYPSGHGGQSWLFAQILSYVDPENAERYKLFGRSIGFRREIAGVHYPSDTVAGRKLGEQIYAKLLEIPAFKKKLDDAKEHMVKPDLSKAYVVTEFDGVDFTGVQTYP